MKFGNGIGIELKRIRREKEMSKQDVCRITGLDIVHLQLIERNKRTVDMDTLIKIVTAFDTSILQFEKYIIHK